MDDIVKQAMAKWPNVPDCYGWLGLDARGNWYMRNDRAQAVGPFAGGNAAAKGSLLRHDKLIDFIQRNYAADAQGRWFFQNGPQRVFVELEATPWIWRIQSDLSVQAHTGQPAQVQQCVLDEQGRSICSPTSASAWCTRRTWRWRRMPCRPACGPWRRWPRSRCRCVSAM